MPASNAPATAASRRRPLRCPSCPRRPPPLPSRISPRRPGRSPTPGPEARARQGRSGGRRALPFEPGRPPRPATRPSAEAVRALGARRGAGARVAVAEPAKPSPPFRARAAGRPGEPKALVPRRSRRPSSTLPAATRGRCPRASASRRSCASRPARRRRGAHGAAPAGAGSVVVKLRVTSDGLNATFTASNADAIPQLQQAGEDLRRSLEARGLTLATLDVRAETGQASERRDQRGWGRSKERRAVEEIDDDSTTVTTSIPVGELVDVHA